MSTHINLYILYALYICYAPKKWCFYCRKKPFGNGQLWWTMLRSSFAFKMAGFMMKKSWWYVCLCAPHVFACVCLCANLRVCVQNLARFFFFFACACSCGLLLAFVCTWVHSIACVRLRPCVPVRLFYVRLWSSLTALTLFVYFFFSSEMGKLGSGHHCVAWVGPCRCHRSKWMCVRVHF